MPATHKEQWASPRGFLLALTICCAGVPGFARGDFFLPLAITALMSAPPSVANSAASGPSRGEPAWRLVVQGVRRSSGVDRDMTHLAPKAAA